MITKCHITQNSDLALNKIKRNRYR